MNYIYKRIARILAITMIVTSMFMCFGGISSSVNLPRTTITAQITTPVAYAADDGEIVDTGMSMGKNLNTKELPWVKLLTDVTKSLSGPVTEAIIAITIAVTGMMVCFGQTGGTYKTFLNIILGASIALQVSKFLVAMAFPEALTNPTVDGNIVHVANTFSVDKQNILGAFMSAIITSVQKGSENLMPYAFQLMGFLVTIELSVMLALDLAGDKIKYVIMQVLKVGFFIFLVQNWVSGTYNITKAIFNTFGDLGLLAAGFSGEMNGDDMITVAMELIEGAWKASPDQSIFHFTATIIWLLLMVGIFVVCIMAGLEIFMVKVEFFLLSALTLPLIPFGLNRHTSWLSEKAIGAIFTIGIKNCVLNFVMALTLPVFVTIINSSKEAAGKFSSQATFFFGALIACWVMHNLVKKAPTLAAGLISGNPSLTAGGMGMSMSNLAGGAAKMTGAGYALSKLGSSGSSDDKKDGGEKSSTSELKKGAGKLVDAALTVASFVTPAGAALKGAAMAAKAASAVGKAAKVGKAVGKAGKIGKAVGKGKKALNGAKKAGKTLKSNNGSEDKQKNQNAGAMAAGGAAGGAAGSMSASAFNPSTANASGGANASANQGAANTNANAGGNTGTANGNGNTQMKAAGQADDMNMYQAQNQGQNEAPDTSGTEELKDGYEMDTAAEAGGYDSDDNDSEDTTVDSGSDTSGSTSSDSSSSSSSGGSSNAGGSSQAPTQGATGGAAATAGAAGANSGNTGLKNGTQQSATPSGGAGSTGSAKPNPQAQASTGGSGSKGSSSSNAQPQQKSQATRQPTPKPTTNSNKSKPSKVKAILKLGLMNTNVGKSFVQGFESTQQNINRFNNVWTARNEGWKPAERHDDFMDSQQLDKLDEIKGMLEELKNQNRE